MKKILLSIVAFFCMATGHAKEPHEAAIKPVIDLPYFEAKYRPGWEERGPEFRRWLAPSVRVTRYGGGGGSGTICYFDAENNWAYVISCGHLFRSGYKSADEYRRSPDSRKITVYYHNEKKLDEPMAYKAEVLCHVWKELYDVSLMRFKPDWIPWVNSIAPEEYPLQKGKYYHSCGCDGLREVAHYSVMYERERSIANGLTDIVTSKNSPRGGRSGGGVFTDDHQLIMICSRGGGGYGYWTSLKQIHKFLKAEKFEFVSLGSLARRIPIKDYDNPGKEYPKEFIPLPSGR